MRYEITPDNVVLAFIDGQDEPFLSQPVHPDGSAWIDQADAELWASLWAAHFNDPANNEFPANRPEATEA